MDIHDEIPNVPILFSEAKLLQHCRIWTKTSKEFTISYQYQPPVFGYHKLLMIHRCDQRIIFVCFSGSGNCELFVVDHVFLVV